VYDARGDRVAGDGPAHSPLAAQIADGHEHEHEHDGNEGDELSVVVPVLSDTDVAGSVRAAVPLSLLRSEVYRAWGLLGALALLILGGAVLLAHRAARRISEPFEQLTAAARHLGGGRYDLQLPRWGMPEADAAGDALRQSAAEVDTLIRHERAFVRDASHQLRTPLAGLVLFLEQQPPDLMGAGNGCDNLRPRSRTCCPFVAAQPRVRAIRI
jgi:signal transduction histidine kinase